MNVVCRYIFEDRGITHWFLDLCFYKISLHYFLKIKIWYINKRTTLLLLIFHYPPITNIPHPSDYKHSSPNWLLISPYPLNYCNRNENVKRMKTVSVADSGIPLKKMANNQNNWLLTRLLFSLQMIIFVFFRLWLLWNTDFSYSRMNRFLERITVEKKMPN